MKILLSTTTYDGKKFCIDKWIESVQKITLPNATIDILLVDNSDNEDFTYYLRSRGINTVHLDISGDNYRKMSNTCEYVRRFFLQEGYDYWFSLETDVIVPSNILEVMTQYKADWVGISYRSGHSNNFASDFGCSLFSRDIMMATDFSDVPDNFTHDSWFMDNKFKPTFFTKVQLYNFLDIKHLWQFH